MCIRAMRRESCMYNRSIFCSVKTSYREWNLGWQSHHEVELFSGFWSGVSTDDKFSCLTFVACWHLRILVPLCRTRDSFIQITFNEALSLECNIGQIDYETIQTLDSSQMQNDLWVLVESRDFTWLTVDQV